MTTAKPSAHNLTETAFGHEQNEVINRALVVDGWLHVGVMHVRIDSIESIELVNVGTFDKSTFMVEISTRSKTVRVPLDAGYYDTLVKFDDWSAALFPEMHEQRAVAVAGVVSDRLAKARQALALWREENGINGEDVAS